MAGESSASTSAWHDRLTTVIRSVLAPLLFLWSGFFSTDFVLRGVYTWPRTSRIFVLTVTLFIVAYEFVYKAHRTSAATGSDRRAWRSVLFACGVPYLLGVGLLLIVAFKRLF